MSPSRAHPRPGNPRSTASPQPVPALWSAGASSHPETPPSFARSPASSRSPPSPSSPSPRLSSRNPADATTAYGSPSLPPRPPSRHRQASPQPQPFTATAISCRPATAGAARAMATQRIADAIASDTSQYALCPGNPERARSIVGRVRDAQADARALATRHGDNWGYRWYLNCCDDLGCSPLRPTDLLDTQREAILGGQVVMNAAAKMTPRDRSRAAADPSSAWMAYKKARFVLHDPGCLLPPLEAVRDVLRGPLRDFVRRYGSRFRSSRDRN